MDATPFMHAAISLVIQALVGLLTGNWWLGGLVACTWWVAREHTQAEYRYLKHASLKRSDVKWLELRVLVAKSAWSKDSILDFVIPTVVATSTYLLITLL